MANVDIRVGKKNAAFFSANPTLVLNDGQFIFNETTSELFIGDGVTQLSSLVAINGASYTLTASEIGSVINGAATATPNDTDLVISVESSVAKKNTWTQIKSFLKTYFDSIYTTTSAVASQITSALSGYVNTSGLTTNYIPKASDSDTLSNSQIIDDGTNVGINVTPTARLHVKGTDSTSSNFVAKIDDSAGTALLHIRNDGRYILNGASLTMPDSGTASYALKSGSYHWYFFTNETFLTDGTVSYAEQLGGTFAVVGTYSNHGFRLRTNNADRLSISNTGVVNIDNLTASQLIATDASKNLQSLDTATYPSLTELSYIKGLTSAVQTQLNNKKDTFILPTSASGFNPADATTYYMGVSAIVPNTTATNFAFKIGYDFRLIGAVITSVNAGTSGTAENNTINFRNITTATSSLISSSVKTNATTTASINQTVTGLNITGTSTDDVCIEWITPTWVTNPTTCIIILRLLFEKLS